MASSAKRTREEAAPLTEAGGDADNYIGGVFVPPAAGAYLDVDAPATGEVIGRVALSDAADVDAAVAAAKAAFPEWSGRTVKSRAAVLMRFHALVKKHRVELAEIIVREHGKNLAEALGDVDKGNETVEYACSLPQLVQGRVLDVSGGIQCRDTRRPVGIVTFTAPFNFPVMCPLWTLPIAIGVGNCFVLKPSEKVPYSARRMAQLLAEAGVPDGVVNIVNGQAPAVTALVDHPDVTCVTFVGSSRVAEIVSKRARNLNKRVLAMGGAKNHLVAMPDCDVEMTSQDVVNSFTGCCGQRCMAASVLLTVGDNQPLLDAVVAKAGALVRGRDARQIGPLIDRAAVERVHRYIAQSEKLGARVLLDGRGWTKEGDAGFWVGPTVILHNTLEDPAMHEEIFGPVLSIFRTGSRDEALRIENANPYGNAACVYTSSGAHARYFTDRFEAGMLGVNIGVPVPREPFSFGGIRRSKFGDFDITADGGIELFTQRIKVTTKWNPPKEQDWMS